MSASRVGSFLWYAVAAALVALYVNMFTLWRGLSGLIGDAAGNVPYGVTLLVLACLGVVAVRSARSRTRTDWFVVACALACAGIGLLATDPDFPSKRIHVPQYIVLALVVRRGLCLRLSGWPLTLVGWAITVVLGCHDELIQGFHPQRTFGVVDILTNGWGAAAGALLAHGFGWMETGRQNGASPPWAVVLATLCVLVALGLELAALNQFKEAVLPYWAMMPLLGGALAWMCVDAASRYGDGWRHALGVLVFLSALAAVYPVISHVAPLAFN
ncbi:MAG: VanZ family protein [Alphaproteobacteria bacterium]